MSHGGRPGDHFKEALLEELEGVVAERSAEQAVEAPPRRSRLLRPALGAVAAVAAAVAVVLIVGGGGASAPRAFAVEPQAGGGVKIEVYSLRDASGLEAALKEAGIRAQVTWLPPGTSCREPHFRPSKIELPQGGTVGGMTTSGPGALTISVMSHERSRQLFRRYRQGELSGEQLRDSVGALNLDPAAFRPDQSVVISGTPRPFGGDPEGGYEASFDVAEGPVRPCQPSHGLVQAKEGPAVARASGAPAVAAPAAGQFLYAKTKVAHLEAWEPNGPGSGPEGHRRYFTDRGLGSGAGALPALVTVIRETWTAPSGRMRVRETLDGVDFQSGADQGRWERAGSPPPFAFDPAEHDVGHDGAGVPVKEFESTYWRGAHAFANVGDLAKAPTDARALRLGIERRRGGGRVTIERLWEILGEPITSPALRAAAINALAEIPGVEVARGVTDVAGRRGDAIRWEGDEGSGFGRELIFDPATATILAEGETVFGPPATKDYGAPAGTPFRQTAFLEAGVVESAQESASASKGGGG